jgi:hypothetical protein
MAWRDDLDCQACLVTPWIDHADQSVLLLGAPADHFEARGAPDEALSSGPAGCPSPQYEAGPPGWQREGH